MLANAVRRKNQFLRRAQKAATRQNVRPSGLEHSTVCRLSGAKAWCDFRRLRRRVPTRLEHSIEILSSFLLAKEKEAKEKCKSPQ